MQMHKPYIPVILIQKNITESSPLPVTTLQINTALMSSSQRWVLSDMLYIHPDFHILLTSNESYTIFFLAGASPR